MAINIRAIWPTLLAIVVLSGFALRTGSAYVIYGFVCPDTCWLVALGAITALTGSIPTVDPFSFTLPMLAQQGNPEPFVIYQWLAELIFYFVSIFFGLPGLVIMGSVFATFAYIALPLRFCIKSNVLPLWTILAVAATCAAGNMRSNVRPELFSAFFIALWLSIILPGNSVNQDNALPPGQSDLKEKSDRPNWIKIASLTAIMLLWSNLHSGFVYGLILLLIYAVLAIFEDVAAKRSFTGKAKTLGLALLASTLATLINPYGFGLWMYLPRLFLTPIVEGVDETMPLSTMMSKTILIVPITCVLLLCFGAIGWNFIQRSKSDGTRPISYWVNLGVVCLAAASCLYVVRLTSFSAIIMTMVTASMIGRNGSKRFWPEKFWNKGISYLVFEIALVLLAVQGVFAIANKYVYLSLPQANSTFEPPIGEMNAFSKAYKSGNVLASFAIADMLDLNFGAHRCLFIDTRLDAYPKEFVNDYFHMTRAQEDYDLLLDKYKIDWAFLVPSENLGAALQHNSKWSLVISDGKALIFKRVESFSK